MKGRETRKDTEIRRKRGKGTERDTTRRGGIKERETRKGKEKKETESTELTEGDTRRVGKKGKLG